MTNIIVGIVLLLIAAVFAIPIVAQVVAVVMSVRDAIRKRGKR